MAEPLEGYNCYLLSLLKCHSQLYPCPTNVNYLWNLGFVLLTSMVLQIISGISLALHYTSDINQSYYSVLHIILESTYGWYLHYLHSIGASFVLGIMYCHIGRSLMSYSYTYNTYLWLSGMCLMIILMSVAFLVLPCLSALCIKANVLAL